MKRSSLLSICMLCAHALVAQQPLPLIRATSKQVKIQDGLNFKADYWVIFPETKPDVYYVDIPRKQSTLTFMTDVDSISFEMSYGETKDFIVLLNGKDSCYTRISANYPKLRTPTKTTHGNDTIPFTMKDNRIYFQGKINGSELLTIQFDLGADAANINAKSVKKIRANFDEKGTLVNSDGSHETRVSSDNQVDIEGLTWRNIELYETKNMKRYEDVIVGNSFFLDQIYTIDYENQVIIIYGDMPEIEPDFIKQNMILDNGVRPVIEATFTFDGVSYTDWFLFDTGNSGTGIIGNRFLTKNDLYDQFSTLIGFGGKKIAFIPELIIANRTFSDGAITLEKQKNQGSAYAFGGLIGNKLLKHFTVIIDNREGFIYLKAREV